MQREQYGKDLKDVLATVLEDLWKEKLGISNPIYIDVEKVPEFDVKDKKFILCMKGIEIDTGKRLSEVMIESGITPDNVAVWVGPGVGQQFLVKISNSLSSYSAIDKDTASKVQKLIDRLEEDDDVQNVWHNWEMED